MELSMITAITLTGYPDDASGVRSSTRRRYLSRSVIAVLNFTVVVSYREWVRKQSSSFASRTVTEVAERGALEKSGGLDPNRANAFFKFAISKERLRLTELEPVASGQFTPTSRGVESLCSCSFDLTRKGEQRPGPRDATCAP